MHYFKKFLFSSNPQGSAQRITRPIACREKQIYHVMHYLRIFYFQSNLQGSAQRIENGQDITGTPFRKKVNNLNVSFKISLYFMS